MTSYSNPSVVRWQKPVAIVVLAILAYVGFTFGSIYWVAYEVKIAATTGCKEYVRAARFETYDDTDPNWRKNFLAGARRAGIRLSDDQYVFTLSDEGKQIRCQAEVAFAQETDWPFIDAMVDVPRIRTVHRTEVDWRYNKKF